MKVVFFGTPLFAANVLSCLLESDIDVAAVVTMPDRARGRSSKLQAPPVKELANRLRPDIPVLQPVKASDPDFVNLLAAYQADLFVVVAYGEIVRQSVLDLPALGCINLHASLLPLYRGAAPIQRSVMDGHTETGVSVMYMVRKMDAGAVIRKDKVAILPDMTAGELEEELCRVGSLALSEVVQDFKSGKLQGVPQDESLVTFAAKLETEDGCLNWSLDGESLYCRYRGVTPRPGAWCWVQVGGVRKRFKILRARFESTCSGVPGEVVQASSKGVLVACKTGALRILEMKLEGKRQMEAADFVNGRLLEGLSFEVSCESGVTSS